MLHWQGQGALSTEFVFGVVLGVLAGTWGDGHGGTCSPTSSLTLDKEVPK